MMDLREARYVKRLSQWKLALKSKVHQSRISLIENGHPSKEYEKERLAKAMGLEINDIEWPDQ